METKRETTKMHVAIDTTLYTQLGLLAEEENRPLGRQLELILKAYFTPEEEG